MPGWQLLRVLGSCRAFLGQPGPSTGPLQCFIARSRGAARLYPRYSLFLDVGHKFLMAARKRKKSKASNYVMSLDEKVRDTDSNRYIPCMVALVRSLLQTSQSSDQQPWTVPGTAFVCRSGGLEDL